LYSSPNIIRVIKPRRMRCAGHIACMGEIRNAYKILVGRPEGKRPLGGHRHRWEDNIKMDLWELRGMCRLDSSVSGQGPVVGSCEHSNESSCSINSRGYD
jgi:hypothetical protein